MPIIFSPRCQSQQLSASETWTDSIKVAHFVTQLEDLWKVVTPKKNQSYQIYVYLENAFQSIEQLHATTEKMQNCTEMFKKPIMKATEKKWWNDGKKSAMPKKNKSVEKPNQNTILVKIVGKFGKKMGFQSCEKKNCQKWISFARQKKTGLFEFWIDEWIFVGEWATTRHSAGYLILCVIWVTVVVWRAFSWGYRNIFSR